MKKYVCLAMALMSVCSASVFASNIQKIGNGVDASIIMGGVNQPINNQINNTSASINNFVIKDDADPNKYAREMMLGKSGNIVKLNIYNRRLTNAIPEGTMGTNDLLEEQSTNDTKKDFTENVNVLEEQTNKDKEKVRRKTSEYMIKIKDVENDLLTSIPLKDLFKLVKVINGNR